MEMNKELPIMTTVLLITIEINSNNFFSNNVCLQFSGHFPCRG